MCACAHERGLYTMRPQRAAVTTTPAEEGLAYEDFVTSPQDSTLKLAGWWMPADNARAALVFFHGAGSNRSGTYFGSLPLYRAMVDQGAAVETGLPPALFAVSAWAATAFYGLPAGEEQALEHAVSLDLPILAIQDLAWKGSWGTHVAAFLFYPQETVA